MYVYLNRKNHRLALYLKLLMTSSSPKACVASSGTIEVSHQGGTFIVSSNLISPYPMTKVWCLQ